MAALDSRVFLFGGYTYVTADAGSDDVALLGDTWSFDGTTWTQLTSSAAPSARYDHAMKATAEREDHSVWRRDQFGLSLRVLQRHLGA